MEPFTETQKLEQREAGRHPELHRLPIRENLQGRHGQGHVLTCVRVICVFLVVLGIYVWQLWLCCFEYMFWLPGLESSQSPKTVEALTLMR